MIYVFLADGFEEIEALTPVDVLRRGGVSVATVGVTGKCVTGSHGISVVCDITVQEAKEDGLEGIVLPGGMPGTLNLEKDPVVQQLIDYASKKGLILAANCAAPSILGHKGLLTGKHATCFNGFERDLYGATVESNSPAVKDGNIITGWGAGGSFAFAFAVLAALTGDEAAAVKLKDGMRVPDNER